ncbi:MAG: hypothetical protein A2039_00300 [Candidatus Melainabacteria bacterium GWA2_34_9]|nr:MAG: hypothetical protein A2039_00300 [Candidatus Melainabacteria bacterium GWA2_34_9]
MDTRRILPIILNYNQPEETDRIYKKLVNDGFKDIISVDNGSDIMPRAKSANFILPKNIKAVGQTKMALIYAMDYFPADYYWILNTSSELFEEINYKERLSESIDSIIDSGINLGILSPALVSDEVIKHQQYKENSRCNYSVCCWCECIAPLISHELLEKTRINHSGFFESKAQRGWVTTHELGYEAVQNQLWWILDHKLQVKWNKNIGYKNNVGGESLNTYRSEAVAEMKMILSNKYGKYWRIKLYLNFLKKTKAKKFPYKVIPYDPFGIWKMFFIKLHGQKVVKNPAYYCIF